MLQPPDILSSSLFVDTSLIGSLGCIICTNVLKDPIQCRNGHCFCRSCLEESMRRKLQCPTCGVELTPTSISSSLVVKNLIEDAHVYCFTRLEALEAANTSTSSNAFTDVETDVDDDVAAGKKRTRAVGSGSSSSSSSGAAAAKRAKADHCMWTGKLCEAKQHFTTCIFASSLCEYACGAVVRRIDMSEHKASFCPNRGVMCTNVGCTAVMPQPMIAAHKANDCLYEMMDCPFSSVGCIERVMRKDFKNHTDTKVNQHMLLLVQDNRSLRHDNRSLHQDIQSLQQTVAEHEERFDGQQHELAYKVKLADLTRGGEVALWSNEKRVRNYKVHLSVEKGYEKNGNCCGVFIHIQNGPFPCRVSYTMEVVHWDGKSESVCKEECTHVYEEAGDWGLLKFIRLSQLTAAASPYVNNNRVTFIVTFRFLPSE